MESGIHKCFIVISSSVNQTARPHLYCFEEVEVEVGEEAEGEEAHHQAVGNQDIIPVQEIQQVS